MITTKVRWIVAAVVAAVAVVLAAIYGKQTRSVLEAKLREIKAREKMLEEQILRASREVAEKAEGDRDAALVRADHLKARRDELARRREQISEERNGGTDVDLARVRNARAG